MNVLFYVEPLTERENPIGKRPWIRFVSMMTSSLCGKDIVGHSFFVLIGEALESEARKQLKNCGVAAITHTELVPRFGRSALEVSLKWYQRKESPGMLNQMAHLVVDKLGEFQPDVCITFSPAPFLSQAFPKAPIFHFELGMVSRPPFPMTAYLDPLGMFKESCLIRFKQEIQRYVTVDEEQALVQKIRDVYLSYLSECNPFSKLLKERLANFRASVLLALQFSQFYGYDAHARFPDQYDLLVQTLAAVPQDVAVIAVEHPEHPVLDDGVFSYLGERYSNFVWDPQFRTVYSTSHYLMEFVNAVVTVSSSVGLQSLLWKKPLIVIGSSHLDLIADAHGFDRLSDVLSAGWPKHKENTLAWLLTRYYMPFDCLFKDGVLEAKLASMVNTGNDLFKFESLLPFAPLEKIAAYYERPLTTKASVKRINCQVTVGDGTVEPVSPLPEVQEKLQAERQAGWLLKQQLEKVDRDLMVVRSRLDEQIKVNVTLNSRIAFFKHMSESLKNDIRIMRESASWRLTYPLRAIMSMIRSTCDLEFRLGLRVLRFCWQSMPVSHRRRIQLKSIIYRKLGFLFRGKPAYIHFGSRQTQLEKIEDKHYLDLSPEPIGSTAIKLITFYLPQFHRIPENDRWWGEGFTEWTNTRKAEPLFDGHHQPRTPTYLGYYNLEDTAVYAKQVELAKKSGIYGFCFHFYWFGGKTLLEKPLRNILANAQIDHPYCICWANENWTRRWDGQDRETLIAQSHSERDAIAFIDYVNEYFRDDRYIKIDGKPLLIVYRPSIIPQISRIQGLWRNHVKELGWPGLFLVSAQTFGHWDPQDFAFDAAVQFPPHHQPHQFLLNQDVSGLVQDFRGNIFDYRQMSKHFCDGTNPKYKLFRGVTLGWDNTARRGRNATILNKFSLSDYGQWLLSACKATLEDPNLGSSEKFVFVNAWNEWAEGAYLEPDNRYGFGYLEATKRALKACRKSDHSLSVIVPNYNHNTFLERRLNSLVHQARKPDEIIFLDDASSDNSVSIARRILSKSNIRYTILINETNSGNVFKQWMKGLERSSGNLIWIAESDDEAAPDFLEKILLEFDREDTLLAYGDISYIEVDGMLHPGLLKYYDELSELDWRQSHRTSAYDAFRGAFAVKNIIPNVSGAVFRKPHLSMDEKERLTSYTFAGDWYFYATITRGGSIAFCKEAKSYFRLHKQSTSRKVLFTPRHIYEHKMVLDDLHELYRIEPKVVQRHVHSLWQVLKHESTSVTCDDFARTFKVKTPTCRKLRICMATYGFCVGGGEVVPIDIANTLRAWGHHITFLVLKRDVPDNPPLLRRRLRNDIPVVYWEEIQGKFNDFLRDFGIEIFNSHNVGVEYTLYCAKFPINITYLASLHGGYETVPNLLTQDFIAYLGETVNEWLYLSEKNRIFLQSRGLDNAPFTKVFNAVNVQSANVDSELNIRKSLNLPKDALLLVLASRALHEKGWQIAIDVTTALRELTDLDFRLLLIGDGPDFKSILMQNSEKYYVSFLGRMDNPFPVIKECDFGIFPSSYAGESFPLFVLECLRGGVPVVASDVGEISRIMHSLGESMPGHVVPSVLSERAMTEEMARAIVGLMADDEKLAEMKVRARKIAENFSADRIAHLYLNVMYRHIERSNENDIS